MNTTHTPGPWTAKFEEAYYVTGPDLGRVAMMMNLKGAHGLGGRRSGEESAANARLIAAAPDLLEALNDLIEAADSMRGTYTFEQGKTPEHEDHHGHEKWAEEFLQERADAASAAIAKATGQKGGA